MNKEKTHGFLSEFRAFILRGNVMDLAVGMMIGAAFTAVVKSLVDDILMPLIGAATAGLDFASLVINVNTWNGPVELRVGIFINTIINLIIIGLVLFLLIRGVNRIVKRKRIKDEAEKIATPPAPSQEELLSEILVELKKQSGDSAKN
ncbi:MAG: large conductance mechanosensitive channel protein MscL [Eubacteriales bacterium]|nr:large conductance mechanosensitive channel protein MscL [Eubacteriales bacterium]